MLLFDTTSAYFATEEADTSAARDLRGETVRTGQSLRACRNVRLVWADAGYAGKLAAWAATLDMALQIVFKRDPQPSRSCPAAGWLNEHSPGSASTGAPPATMSTCRPATKP